MQGSKARPPGTLSVQRRFEPSRLQEEFWESVYDALLSVVPAESASAAETRAESCVSQQSEDRESILV